MSEQFPSQSENVESNLQDERSKLVEELSNSVELSFSGIEASLYSQMKADEEDFPGFCNPIDDVIERFKAEGVKVISLDNGSVFVVPAGSTDFENDRIRPRGLELNDDMDERLKKLIILDRQS